MAQTLTTLQLEPFASELECDEKECFSFGRDKDKHREYNMKHKQRASLPENATHTIQNSPCVRLLLCRSVYGEENT